MCSSAARTVAAAASSSRSKAAVRAQCTLVRNTKRHVPPYMSRWLLQCRAKLRRPSATTISTLHITCDFSPIYLEVELKKIFCSKISNETISKFGAGCLELSRWQNQKWSKRLVKRLRAKLKYVILSLQKKTQEEHLGK